MNESCVQSMRCTCRCIGSGGRQEFALSHPRIYPTPASQGAGLWNHPCVRGPLFLVPVFFTDWPPAAEPPVRRSWTEFAWAFAFRSSKPFRSVPTRGPFADHPREGGLLRQDKRCAPDVKLLNYPPSSNPTTGRNRRAFREISSNPPSYVLKFPPRVAWERERRRETSRLRVLARVPRDRVTRLVRGFYTCTCTFYAVYVVKARQRRNDRMH